MTRTSLRLTLTLAAVAAACTLGLRAQGPLSNSDAELQFQLASLLYDETRYGEALQAFERAADLAGKALVVGTTGVDAEVRRLLDEAARASAVLVAANFSVGVNLLLGLAEAAARVLPAELYDVEIVEAHHRRKVDAPSGTALALGEMIARGRRISLEAVRRDGRSGHTETRNAGEIGFHSLRGGDIVGEHHVHFIGMRERIELAHSAQDRAVFAEGALHAAQWLVAKPPGQYGMLDMLGLRSLP